MKKVLLPAFVAFLCCLVFVNCFAVAAQQEPELIPRDVIFGNPVNASPRISPDGAMMAYLAPLDGVLNVWVRTVGKEDQRPVTSDRNRGIHIYFWAYDNKHIVYLQDVGGNENWRVYAVDVTTGDTKDLTPFENVQVRVVDSNKNFPDKMLIAMNRDNPQLHDVYLLDMTTGSIDLKVKNPGNHAGWITDANLEVRGALAIRSDGGSDLLIREDEQSEWRTVISWDAEDVLTSHPICFTRDGKSLYLIDSRGANTGRFTKLEIATGEFEVIAEDSIYDVSNALINPDTFEPEAVAFLRARTEWKILDRSLEEDFEIIRKADHGDLVFIDRSNDYGIWIVGFTKDDSPFSYYLYDRKLKKVTFLFDSRPVLRQYKLAPMEPISFTASDGLTIHGYITYPPWKGRKNLPLVVVVHGGPWARDTWGYNPDAQWLANRGYACLQVNFRGSAGYGKNFINAGDKEWGGKMHQDIVDAVMWAISGGIADPERIAIYGGSYGGYAALVGATFTPDLFCCAVDVVGPSNLLTWITSIPPYWSIMREILYKRIGNPETESEFLKSRSPLFYVDRIKIPMLIAQGANDPRVPRQESEQIVNALKERGIYHEYMLFEDEGHGFAKPENRLKFYAAAERFLARYLGGRVEE
ncbi:MAG: S9 family peptidase [bacterium]